MNHTKADKVPITVLSGYVGSGKSTLINYVLRNRAGLRVAVIVNNEASFGRARIHNKGLTGTAEELANMSDGSCIYCAFGGDLFREAERIAKEGRFDYILIEASGVGEPLPVAQTFSDLNALEGSDLSLFCRLDCMVTLVDAHRFWQDFFSGDSLHARRQASGKGDNREVVDVLIEQIELCDVLVLNKCDLMDDLDLEELESVLRKLQPRAKFIRTSHGVVNPAEILHTGLFHFEEASLSAGWIKELEKPQPAPESDEYGIAAFVYERIRPFHPERLYRWMRRWPEEVVRSKGIVWLASRPTKGQNLSQAGSSVQFGPSGSWIAALPEVERQTILLQEPGLSEWWDAVYGDRINKIVFIGIDMNQAAIVEALDACLLSEEEMSQDWSRFPDPLPNASPEPLSAYLKTITSHRG